MVSLSRSGTRPVKVGKTPMGLGVHTRVPRVMPNILMAAARSPASSRAKPAIAAIAASLRRPPSILFMFCSTVLSVLLYLLGKPIAAPPDIL